MALTRIIATVGPSLSKQSTLLSLIKSGVDVFRFNLKFNDHQWHSEHIEKIRKASEKAGTPVAILLDLQGSEVRLGNIPGEKRKVKKGQRISFVEEKSFDSYQDCIPISDCFFQSEIKKGRTFFIDEGRIKFKILEKKQNTITGEVLEGGIIKSRKGINFPDVEVSFPSLLAKDIKDISLATKHEIDYLALSFVRKRKDIELLKKQLEKLSLRPKILAKIETSQALDDFENILDASNGIMIARGDLGVEIPLEQVPYYQKKIIEKCIEAGKPVITATQMLDSMSDSPFPTRAEVSDVANAVLDYTDAVMLSRETAIGKHPLKTVAVAERICRFWEQKRDPPDNFKYELNHQTASVCFSAYKLWRSPFCQKEKVKAFVAVTRSGLTAQMLSRLRPNLPIIGMTNDGKVRNQLCLLYGVSPIFIKNPDLYKKRSARDISKILSKVKEHGFAKKGEKVIMLYAEDWKTEGKTNIVRIQEIP